MTPGSDAFVVFGATGDLAFRPVEAAWRIVDGILGDRVPVRTNDPVTRGPSSASGRLRAGAHWHDPA
jgi:glucose-6-phosphate 1-dehydrogenase